MIEALDLLTETEVIGVNDGHCQAFSLKDNTH